jgi:hypothetical protein
MASFNEAGINKDFYVDIRHIQKNKIWICLKKVSQKV